MAESEGTRPGLVRVVSRWELVGVSVNTVVGSGVYLLPAAAAALLGPSSLLAVLLAGAAVSLLVLCFAEAGSHFEEPGAAYLYAREAFGAFVGCEVGWMSWLARIAAVASLSAGLAQATAFLWPGAASSWGRAAVIVVPLVALAWINVVGVRAGARTAVGLVIAKTLPLLFFIAVGVLFVDVGALAIPTAPSAEALRRAALLLLFAYAGFENAPAAAGEYRDPRRDVPFALLMTVLIVTLLYTGVQAVALGTLPGLAASESPLAEAAGRFSGSWGVTIMTAGAAVSILGTNSSSTLAGPRFAFALARDGFGPRALGRIHPRWRTPAVAVVAQTSVALALALTGSFVQLALLSVIARLLTYLSTAAAVPVLRRRFAERPATVRLPGGPVIPILACLLSLALLASATWGNLLAGGLALLVGAGLYAFRREPEVEDAARSV